MPGFEAAQWFTRLQDLAADLHARLEWDRFGSNIGVALYDGDNEPATFAGPSLESASWGLCLQLEKQDTA